MKRKSTVVNSATSKIIVGNDEVLETKKGDSLM